MSDSIDIVDEAPEHHEGSVALSGEGNPEVPSPSGTFVRLLGPFFTTSFTFTTEAGATLVVSKEGVYVPDEDVAALFAAAADSGVHLAQGK